MATSSGFTRRTPDIMTEELCAIPSRKSSFEFKPLYDLIYANLQARNAASGGEDGRAVVLVKRAPGTIIVDPGFADGIYVEAITTEVVEINLEREAPDAMVATIGGEAALDVAMELNRDGAGAGHNVIVISPN